MFILNLPLRQLVTNQTGGAMSERTAARKVCGSGFTVTKIIKQRSYILVTRHRLTRVKEKPPLPCTMN